MRDQLDEARYELAAERMNNALVDLSTEYPDAFRAIIKLAAQRAKEMAAEEKIQRQHDYAARMKFSKTGPKVWSMGGKPIPTLSMPDYTCAMCGKEATVSRLYLSEVTMNLYCSCGFCGALIPDGEKYLLVEPGIAQTLMSDFEQEVPVVRKRRWYE